MNQSSLQITKFDYHLPEERVAFFPLEERDTSRLLQYRDSTISDHRYTDLPLLVPRGTLLLFNNTRVIEARLLFRKPSGGNIEVFCLEPSGGTDLRTAMAAHGPVRWDCMVGGASKWKNEMILEQTVQDGQETFRLTAGCLEKRAGSMVVELGWDRTNLCFAEVLHLAGAMPLPPYIRRRAEQTDSERYQTVFAKEKGSVAAPTAGLHFTNELLGTLDRHGVHRAWLTLHVGAGTFKPVSTDLVRDHEMHAESIEVSLATIREIIAHLDAGIITVGTTSLRTLESLYWLAVKYLMNEEDNEAGTAAPWFLDQWEAYQLPQHHEPREAFEAMESYLLNQGAESITARTRIIIMPGYQVRCIRALITNFHQPKSTLLLLISAITGDDWKKIYDHALRNEYRFLSYGDGSILWV